MAGDDQPKAGESITLDSLQRDILIAQIQAFLDATTDPQAREVYLALKSAIESLEVPVDLQLRLGAIVEVALTSGLSAAFSVPARSYRSTHCSCRRRAAAKWRVRSPN